VARLRGSSQVRVRSQRRRTDWSEGTGGTTATAVSTSSAQFLGSALVPVVLGSTIVRIRGHIDLVGTLATAAGDGFTGAVGIGIASTRAVVAGVGSVPTPITNQAAENWLWWHSFSVVNAVVSSTEITRSFFQRLIIDSKAMRKFEDNTVSLYAMIEPVEIGTATMSVFHDSRVLSMLA